MTDAEFHQNILIKKEMEVKCRGTTYVINYGTDSSGKEFIAFGEQFLPPKHFYSYGELLNEAFLGVAPMRYSIEHLELLNP